MLHQITQARSKSTLCFRPISITIAIELMVPWEGNTSAEGSSRQDPDSDSDSNLGQDLDSGFESLKKRIFDKLRYPVNYYQSY